MDQNNNLPQQPQPNAPPQPQTQPEPSQQPVRNPGTTLGIIGIVLSFLFLQLIGIVLSIISTVKSNKAHTSPILGIIGIVLNGIGLLLVPIFAMILIAAANGVQDRAELTQAKTNALQVVKRAEAFNATEGRYPASISEFSKYDVTRLDDLNVVSTPPSSPDEVQYVPCDEDGAQIIYFKSYAEQYTAQVLPLYAVGTAPSTPGC